MIRRMLKLAGICLVIVVFAFVALFVALGVASRKTQKAANAIKSGMTIEQFVQNFPGNSDVAILQREENAACDLNAAMAAREPATPKAEAPKLAGRKATDRRSNHPSDRQSDRESEAQVSEDCSPPSPLFVTWPAQRGGKVNIRSFSPGRKLDLNLLPDAEFVTFLKSEFPGSPWQAHFAYTSMSPRTYSFTVHFGPDGKVIGAPAMSSLD